MNDQIHVYCDESCHLEHDHAHAMVLGAVWCPASHRGMLARKIKTIKKQFGLAPGFEIKWVKVSPARLDFYRAVLDFFFDEAMLHFRALVVPDKQLLDHGRFKQNHDEFYYKMWYLLLNPMLNPDHHYRIFLDIKDTQGQAKISKLHNALCHANDDVERTLIQSIEMVHSHDVLWLQLTDLLSGAVAYAHRGLHGSAAKLALVSHIRARVGLPFEQSSPPSEEKFNFLVWRPKS